MEERLRAVPGDNGGDTPLQDVPRGSALRFICEQYMQMVPLRFFDWATPLFPEVDGSPNCSVTSWEAQGQIVACLLHHPHSRRYPVAPQYQAGWLKAYLAICEAAGEEDIQDALYEAASALCRNAVGSADDRCYKTYSLPFSAAAGVEGGDTGHITLRETRQYISAGTTGLCAWPAAMYMAGWVALNAGVFAKRNVLELGAGTGLAGFSVAKMSDAASVTISDCHGQVLQLLAENAEINGFGAVPILEALAASTSDSAAVNLSIVELDWRDPRPETLLAFQGTVVIGADIVYDPDIIPALTNVLFQVLSGNTAGGVAYLASTLRNPHTLELFVESLTGRGLIVEVASMLEAGAPRLPDTASLLVYDSTCPIVLHRISASQLH